MFPIFPEGSLTESVVTTVWVGVFVVAFFNLRFGWVLSGLVVPGYIVPLILLRPVSVVVILIEAMLAYGIVRGLSTYPARFPQWSSFFGRDRFFALVLTSVVLRVLIDGYVLPPIARYGTETGLWNLEVESNLHSFGLIIISLIANQFWKPGFRRGFMSLAVTTGITLAIVRFGLMNFTNLSLSNLMYMYEDMSASILSSPKAYIILLVSAHIASRLNFHYSWDFNGILLPSLLALQWYDPLRILTSFIEAGFTYLVAKSILKASYFQGKTIEGARKLLLFFNISFVYKMILGHTLVLSGATVSVVDCYGFGYLLPTLLAVKMYDRQSAARITRTTVQASLFGVIVASGLGFLLTVTPDLWVRREATAVGLQTVEQSQVDLVDQVRGDRVRMYGVRLREVDSPPSDDELASFQRGLRQLRRFSRDRDERRLEEASRLLALAKHEVIRFGEEQIYVRDVDPQRWGVYVLHLQNPDGVVLEAPAALREWGTFESAMYLSQRLRASAVAVTTRGRSPKRAATADSLVGSRSFFQTFHREFRSRGVMQVRGYTTELFKTLWQLQVTVDDLADHPLGSSLWVSRRMPATLSLGRLRGALHEMEPVRWDGPKFRNIQRSTSSGFAELFLSRKDRRSLHGRFFARVEDVAVQPELRPIAGYLQDWILKTKHYLGGRGTNTYVVPEMEALLLLDEEVVQPLLRLARNNQFLDVSDEGIASQLRSINVIASAFGYEVSVYLHRQSGQHYLILREDTGRADRTYWGLYVFRVGESRPVVVEVPRPIYERNTFEYGVSLFEDFEGFALLIAGAHPQCNVDGSADVIRRANKQSVFHLVHQRATRQLDSGQGLVIQTRAFGLKDDAPLPKSDLLVAFGMGNTRVDSVGFVGSQLITYLEESTLSVEFVRGTRQTSGYEPYGTLQAQHLGETEGIQFAALWLSPLSRFGYRREPELRTEEILFDSLGIETREILLERVLGDSRLAPAGDVPEELLRMLEHFQNTQDITALSRLRESWPDLLPVRVIHASTQKSFIVFYRGEELLPLAAAISFRPREAVTTTIQRPIQAHEVQNFAASNASVLLIEDSP